MNLDNYLQKTISWLFAGMFFLVPLFFTPVNSELFEFNKIILVYAFTALITGIWFARIILARKIIFKRSFLDIPLALFLASQVVSTIFSIDPHTSIFGYYSRFNGGLLSAISYLLLYWAFVSNCGAKDVKKSIKFSLVSAVIISIYGILEHFGHSFSCLMFGSGFNVSCWVQKVQERVFATLGQPNWLAAYLAILIPISFANLLNQAKKPLITQLLNYLITFAFYLCLLFTQSRSGFLGFVLSFVVFWAIAFFVQKNDRKLIIKPFLFLIFALCALILFFGSPFSKINKYFTLNGWQSSQNTKYKIQNTTPSSSLDGGISESGDIRKIVWKGALGIFKHYPLFGSGVETFAYSYYNFRPIEHNLVSEWDFLYNKAHNEYLNYLSTTGIFGLGSYLLFIGTFITMSLRAKRCNPKRDCFGDKPLAMTYLPIALFSGWLSLLVTNFFGFSVVVTSLYFFLIPAFATVLASPNTPPSPKTHHPSPALAIPLLAVSYMLFAISNLWRADFFYNQGLKLSKQGKSYESYQKLDQAIQISPTEPVFLSEIAASTANLVQTASQQEPATASAEMIKLALAFSDKAKAISPKNLNIVKSRIKVFYTLSTIQPEFLQKAIDATKEAINLSPTDPKLVYNLGLLYGKSGRGLLAIQTIEKAVEMKPNYYDARNALALFYEDIGENKKAVEQLKIMLQMAPENKTQFEEKIKQLGY